MRVVQPTLLALGALLLGACLEPAPKTRSGDPCGDSNVAGASPATCLVLDVSMDEAVRRDAPGDLRGDLHWGLYRDGDVGALGPGDHASVLGDFVPDVDLSATGSGVTVPIPDVPAGDYQVLGYLDDDGDGESSAGDPVTLPSAGFSVPEGERTEVQMVLNYLR